MENPEEIKAITEILASFHQYEEFARKEILAPKQLKHKSLTQEEQDLIPWFEDHLNTLSTCIHHNGTFFKKLAMEIAPSWGITTDPSTWGKARYQDYDKVKSVLKQIVREWSTEGLQERNISYDRIFPYLERIYPDLQQRYKVKVLVPGAGLGRMNYEFVKRGFWCQGNEFSYHMLLPSNYILNKSYLANGDSVFPFIHNNSNQLDRKFQTRPVFFPDELSSSELYQLQQEYGNTINFGELMSIASGSFTDLYGPDDLSISSHYSQEPQAKEFRIENKESFDVVVTNFFIDTASNPIEYLKTIHHCLQKNGVWINFGPLLWHFEDSDDIEETIRQDGTKTVTPMKGLELSLQDLIELAENWFVFEKRESGIKVPYASDIKSMGGWQYKCEFWVARKK